MKRGVCPVCTHRTVPLAAMFRHFRNQSLPVAYLCESENASKHKRSCTPTQERIEREIMLQQEQSEEAKAETSGMDLAAQTRVTPQELAEAVAKLEARREAEHQQRAETIPLGEVVHQLNLSASSEELLTEVEAVRKERARKAQQEQYDKDVKGIFRFVFAVVTFSVIVTLGAINLTLRHRLNEAAQSFTPLPIKPLSQVPDNVPVHVSSDSLGLLASGLTPSDKIFVDTRVSTGDKSATMFNNEWTLLKSGGGYFVRTWATADMALRAANNEASVVFSNSPAWLPAANLVSVQLPVYRFKRLDTDSFTVKGEKATAATSVLESATLQSADDALTSVVHTYVLTKQPDMEKSVVDTKTNQWVSADFIVETKGEHVRLTGTTYDKALKEQATTLTQEALQAMDVHAHIINDIKVEKSWQVYNP